MYVHYSNIVVKIAEVCSYQFHVLIDSIQ